MPDDRGLDDVQLADLIDERSDIPRLRDRLKGLAEQRRSEGFDTKIGDLLAQSAKNDAAYITPGDLEKAEWAADLYDAEGRPEIHPRGFHYQLVGKGYEMRDGSEYTNSKRCWTELKEAIKWARILGLIDNDRIKDEKNEDATPTAFADIDQLTDRVGAGSGGGGSGTTAASDRGGAVAGTPRGALFDVVTDALADVRVHDGYVGPTLPDPDDIEAAKLSDPDVDDLIDSTVDALVDRAFTGVDFDPYEYQPYYIEIWAEKSGVIPETVAEDYGATIRPAGGGEFSLSMCQEAVDIAHARGQDLAVVTVTDFDSKGSDMPKSAARKLEVEAALRDVDVELVHGAVTVDQVKAYGIPGAPSSTPQGLEHGNIGAKGYETMKEMFRDHAGQYPVEIRAFETKYPAAFKTELEEQLQPFFDEDLDDRLERAVESARDDARAALRDAFDEHRPAIEAALDDLRAAVDDYQRRVEPTLSGLKQGVEQVRGEELTLREEANVPSRRSALADVLADVEIGAAVREVDLTLPSGDADGLEAALLDTRRGLLSQLEAYKEYDMRYE